MKLKYLLWPLILILLIMVGLQRNVQRSVTQELTDFKHQVTGMIPKPKTNYVVNTKDNDAGLQTITSGDLSRVYYYHFAKQTSPKVKKLFTAAVNRYNQTKIVKLQYGNANNHQNGITFGTYNKADRSSTNNSQASMIELGVGGPTMIQYSGRENYTINHASAKLNRHYADSYKLSVAMHELGHALGLNHSSSTKSIMYPVDRGTVNLSRSDLKHLANLYPRTK